MSRRTLALDFVRSIRAAKRAHKYGAAVTVHSVDTYRNGTRLFLASDGMSGAAVTRDGDLISVFKHPDSPTSIDPILRAAVPYARTLDAFDIGGMLPRLYARYGFRVVARLPFDDTQAPENWDYGLMGRPDVVFMVRDYGLDTGKAPVVASWSEAKALQTRALEA